MAAINQSAISKADKDNLCTSCLDAVMRFYEDPANRQRFEAWRDGRWQAKTPAAKPN